MYNNVNFRLRFVRRMRACDTTNSVETEKLMCDWKFLVDLIRWTNFRSKGES